MTARRALYLALLTLATASALGCTSDPRYAQGLQWIMEDAAQKQRLESMGFPQYTPGPS